MVSRVVKPGFVKRVADVVRTIPRGRVTTYGDVAAALGARGVARHVGWALAALPVSTPVPWHRVVNAKGEASARTDGVGDDVQRLRLQQEGIALDARGRIIAFATLRFTPRPLPDDAPAPRARRASTRAVTKKSAATTKTTSAKTRRGRP